MNYIINITSCKQTMIELMLTNGRDRQVDN